jgi:hypothetical protein
MIVTGIPKYFYSAKYLSDNKYHRDWTAFICDTLATKRRSHYGRDGNYVWMGTNEEVVRKGCVTLVFGRLRLKCDGIRAETRFCLSAKRTTPFKSAGASVQSTTGSRGVRISGSNAGYTMFRCSVKGTG